jgi:hypothetical protein
MDGSSSLAKELIEALAELSLPSSVHEPLEVLASRGYERFAAFLDSEEALRTDGGKLVAISSLGRMAVSRLATLSRPSDAPAEAFQEWSARSKASIASREQSHSVVSEALHARWLAAVLGPLLAAQTVVASVMGEAKGASCLRETIEALPETILPAVASLVCQKGSRVQELLRTPITLPVGIMASGVSTAPSRPVVALYLLQRFAHSSKGMTSLVGCVSIMGACRCLREATVEEVRECLSEQGSRGKREREGDDSSASKRLRPSLGAPVAVATMSHQEVGRAVLSAIERVIHRFPTALPGASSALAAVLPGVDSTVHDEVLGRLESATGLQSVAALMCGVSKLGEASTRISPSQIEAILEGLLTSSAGTQTAVVEEEPLFVLDRSGQ